MGLSANAVDFAIEAQTSSDFTGASPPLSAICFDVVA
jgi:hypothetical protein